MKKKTTEKKKPMKMDDILALIRALAVSQGSYGRLYVSLMEMRDCDPVGWDALKKEWESMEFESPVDFVLYYEGGM